MVLLTSTSYRFDFILFCINNEYDDLKSAIGLIHLEFRSNGQQLNNTEGDAFVDDT